MCVNNYNKILDETKTFTISKTIYLYVFHKLHAQLYYNAHGDGCNALVWNVEGVETQNF